MHHIQNMILTEQHYYNALNLLYHGNYSRLKKIWEQYQSWEKAWRAESGNGGLSPEKEWVRLKGNNTELILQTDAAYPFFLKNIFSPPFGIYVLGNIDYQQPAVAIVGTRAATPAGKETARIFAKTLAKAGITIVSGLALGIDAAAHSGALETNGKTIAVLGTPLNNLYPKQNENLAKQILKSKGAIISEFPFSREYTPSDFLVRNRIISGLADATLVIEAPEKSGALATAKFALDQNREIFVVPGNINNKNYIGSNSLIKAGAAIVTEPKDILNYFGLAQEKTAATEEKMGAPETIIFQSLKNQPTECTVEKLAKDTKLEITILNQTLALMTIKGIIKELNGKYFLN